MPIITELKQMSNRALNRVPEGVLWLAVIALASSGSFGLGYLSGTEAKSGEVIIQSRGALLEEAEPRTSTLQAAAVQAVVQTEPELLPPPPEGGGQYVASKSGKSYHLPWCAGAKQIKEGNKIYFDSKAEAEAAGYAPAKNCKGI